MSNNNQGKKQFSKEDFNPTIAPFYEMKTGYWSIPLDGEAYDRIMKHVERGVRLVLRIAKTRPKDTSPHAYLEVISAEKALAFKNARGGSERTSTVTESDGI